MKRLVLVVLAAAVVYGCSDDGPWGGPAGTKMGLKLEQIEKHAVLQKEGSNNVGATIYSSKQAPKLNAQADSYNYVFTKGGDLCLVQMRFENINRSSSPLMIELKSKYGMPVKDERVPWGVVWSSSKYKLSDDIIEITSEFTGREPRVSALVSFWYENFDQCRTKE